MSDFQCPVVRVKIESHPNADAIEIARIGDFQSIVKKGQFKDGDLAVYIPEFAVLPEWLLKEMGFWDALNNRGTLTSAAGNRVKAIKLRGVLSQGIVLQVGKVGVNGEVKYAVGRYEGGDPGIGDIYDYMDVFEGTDAAEWLGVTKWAPPVPSHMAGRIIGADLAVTTKYDFENIKKTPDLFEDGEEVVITEKIHGTLMMVGVVPESMANEKYYRGRVIVTSKGMGQKGWILDHSDESNLYAQAAKKHGLLDGMFNLYAVHRGIEKPVFIFGEVYGKTMSGAVVQDLTYTGEELAFRLFDACIGAREAAEYGDWWELQELAELLSVDIVPTLYVGPYSKQVVLDHTDGKTTLGGAHIREGVVVKSAGEIKHPKYGRKIAKSISEKYLLRKGETTEFN